MKYGSLNLLQHSGLVQGCTGIALPFTSRYLKKRNSAVQSIRSVSLSLSLSYDISIHEINNIPYFNNQLNAQFLYSIIICMLRYNPRHFSSINMPIFRRTNCIITASGIVTLCKRLYSMPDESMLSFGILYGRLQRVTIPDAVIIHFVLLKMGMLMFETCRGL